MVEFEQTRVHSQGAGEENDEALLHPREFHHSIIGKIIQKVKFKYWAVIMDVMGTFVHG